MRYLSSVSPGSTIVRGYAPSVVGSGSGCGLVGLLSFKGVPLRFLAGLFISRSALFAAARLVGLLDLFLGESLRGTEVVLVMRLPGLPSRGSASTVTFMRHGLPSAFLGVSKISDLEGVALLRFILRGDGLLLLRVFRIEWVPSGDEGSVRGSGDVSLLEETTSLMRAPCFRLPGARQRRSRLRQRALQDSRQGRPNVEAQASAAVARRQGRRIRGQRRGLCPAPTFLAQGTLLPCLAIAICCC